MYLRRIEIHGFKSFANRIQLEFQQGINAIVGPNGSGKSNIIDAVRWVLGEQSIKTLRGMKLEDVIFTGSNMKRAMGMAEVVITLDNSDHLIPIDYTEVSFTRRAFRSGESEFYINKTPCRLKDIQELLIDTGIGKDGYSIISQGRIDEILAHRPEERRAIFEEAAGIMKHKVRKKEAEKRLEETMDNLARVDDILNEMELQLSPLAIQKETAIQYLEYSSKFKELDVNMLLMEYQSKENTLIDIQKTIAEQQSRLDDNNEIFKSTQEQLLEHKTELDTNDEKYEKIQNQLFSISDQRKNLQRDAEWTQNEIKRLEEIIQSTAEKLCQEKDKICEIKNLLSSKIQELEQKIKDINQLEIETEDKQKQFLVIENDIGQKEKLIDTLKGDVIDLLNDASNKRNTISSLITMKQNLDHRLKQIERDELQINDANNKTSNEIDIIQGEIKQLDLCISDHQKKLEELRGFVEDRRQKLSKGEKSEADHQHKLSVVASRFKALKEINDNFEGFQFGVKNLLFALKNKKFTGDGIYGTVADAITVDQKYETAIEIALGAALQNIICETEGNAKQAIEYLKKNNLGRVTFLPLSSVKPRSLGSRDTELLSMKGCISTAVELVSFDEKYYSIMANLLGKVIIVDNIDNAISMANKSGFFHKIVTLQGEVLNPGGSITGGSQKRSNSILARKRELSEGQGRICELENQLKKIIKDNGELREVIDEHCEIVDNELSSLNDAKSEINALNKQLHEKHILLDERLERIKVLEREKQQIAVDTEEIESEISLIEDDIGDIDTKNVTSQTQVRKLQAELAEDKQKKEVLSGVITEYKVKIASARQEKIALKQTIKNLESDQDLRTQEMENAKDKLKEDKESLGLAGNKILECEDDIKIHIKKEEELDVSLESLKQQKSLAKECIEEIQMQLDKLIREQKKLEKSLHENSILQNTLDIEQRQVRDRLNERYTLSLSEARELERDLGSIDKIKAKLDILNNKIESLGSVNLKAIEDYDHLKARYDFLTDQKNDLINAKDKLDILIGDIVRTMEELLITSISEINEEFKKVFVEMFGGGKAELIIDDTKSILECGIEINAQPPGKKLQNLLLLSGGERALTAIALLFAILNTKATPFCILDEIEAALDDANIDRFTRYLKKVSKHTQFIIITHRKGTMEAADALYGIAMEETAVSQVLSVQIEK